MKTKILLSILVAAMFVTNINALTVAPTWYIYLDSIGWKYIEDDFDKEYLPVNAYITEIPVYTSVNEQGTAVVNVPLKLPDIGNALKPDLSLCYNSMQSGNMFGSDWMLSGLSEINRVRKKYLLR